MSRSLELMQAKTDAFSTNPVKRKAGRVALIKMLLSSYPERSTQYVADRLVNECIQISVLDDDQILEFMLFAKTHLDTYSYEEWVKNQILEALAEQCYTKAGKILSYFTDTINFTINDFWLLSSEVVAFLEEHKDSITLDAFTTLPLWRHYNGVEDLLRLLHLVGSEAMNNHIKNQNFALDGEVKYGALGILEPLGMLDSLLDDEARDLVIIRCLRELMNKCSCEEHIRSSIGLYTSAQYLKAMATEARRSRYDKQENFLVLIQPYLAYVKDAKAPA